MAIFSAASRSSLLEKEDFEMNSGKNLMQLTSIDTQTRHRLRVINFLLMAFSGFSLLVYFVMNGGAYWRVIRYDIFLATPLASSDLKVGGILEVADVAPAAIAANLAQGEYQLIIPKIEVSSPIANPHDATKQGILASLEEGVGLYPGSVDAGKIGRTILLGHSSRATWYRGGYATVFALLSKLEKFDTFYLVGDGTKYTYQVFDTKNLPPAETNTLLNTPSAQSEVDLVTCYPIGSASQRTVVQAALVKMEKI